MVAQKDPPHRSSFRGANEAPGDNANGKYQYQNQYLGQPRPIRVIIIGAGLSGIAAVKIFKERFAGEPVELIIYEKNEDVTGTWLENRYPGYGEKSFQANFADFSVAARVTFRRMRTPFLGKAILSGPKPTLEQLSFSNTSKVEL